MSLRDTIEAARKEAQEAGVLPKAGAEDANDKAESDEERAGFTRRSVARAKPSREAAQGVRVVNAAKVRSGEQTASGKSVAQMSKDERREARRLRREREDSRASASRVLLRDDPTYKRGQRVWWVLLGAGFGATVTSTILINFYPDVQTDPLSVPGLLSIALIVLAYGGIVSALIYDWRKVKPLRTAAEAAVSGMSDKKVAQILRQDAEMEARRKASKAEARAAKRSVRKTRHE